MKRALPALLATAALVFPALVAPALADDPLLSRLVGSWTGRGSYKESAAAASERILCKITNTLVQNGTALQQSGRCSISSGSSGISGLIKASGGGRYSGSITSMASDGPASFTGTGSSSRLTLSMSFTDGRTHTAAKSVTTMALTGGGYHLTTTRRDGGWTSNDISFTK